MGLQDRFPGRLSNLTIVVNYDRCAHCGACVPVCSPDAITLCEATLVIDQATCTRCERCALICPTGALTLLPMPALAQTD